MSHTSSIKAVQITSVTALTAAVAMLARDGVKCSLIPGATPRAFYPNQPGMGPADYVLRLDGADYDVGFYKQESGIYEARTDFWGGSVERCLGGTATNAERAEQAKLGKLFQAYGVQATMEAARRRGQTVQTRKNEKGQYVLEITGANL